MAACTHLDQIKEGIKAKTPNGCEECLKSGDKWIALRMCLTCGHIGCCDSSKNKHATAHFEQNNHPLMQAFGNEGETWRWCYIDKDYL